MLGGHLSRSEYMSCSVLLPSLSLQLSSGMCPEYTFLMAPPTQRITFEFLRLPLKAFPFLAHPLYQPHRTPSSNPAYDTSGKKKQNKFLSFLKEVCISVTWKKFYWCYGHPLKSHHSLCLLQSYSFPSSVHVPLLISTSTACVTIMFVVCAKHWRHNSEWRVVPEPKELK